MRHDEGFSLIEALVATAIVAAGLGMLAQLAFSVMRGSERARLESFALLTASEKLEQLRAAASAGDLAAVMPSPAGALDANVQGYFEILDRDGSIVANPGAAAGSYVRRWSIEGGADPDRFHVHVVVVRRGLGVRTHLVGSARLHAGL